jgi:hypothetical protein
MNRKIFYLDLLVYTLLGTGVISFVIAMYNMGKNVKPNEDFFFQDNDELIHQKWWMHYSEVDSLILKNNTFFLESFWHGMTEREFRNVIRRCTDLEFPSESYFKKLKSGVKPQSEYFSDDFVDRNYFDTIKIDNYWIMTNRLWEKCFKQPVFVHFIFNNTKPNDINSRRCLKSVKLSVKMKKFSEYDSLIGFLKEKYKNYYKIAEDEYGFNTSSLYIRENTDVFIKTSQNNESPFSFKIDIIYYDNRYNDRITRPQSYTERADSINKQFELNEKKRLMDLEKEIQHVF